MTDVVESKNTSLWDKTKAVLCFVGEHPVVTCTIAFSLIACVAIGKNYNMSGNVLNGSFSLNKAV